MDGGWAHIRPIWISLYSITLNHFSRTCSGANVLSNRCRAWMDMRVQRYIFRFNDSNCQVPAYRQLGQPGSCARGAGS